MTIRGVLCFSCNRGLGRAKDRPNTLRAMIAYLANPAPGPEGGGGGEAGGTV